MYKLMNQRIARENRPVADIDMTGDTGIVDQNSMVADNAVMAHMGIGHK